MPGGRLVPFSVETFGRWGVEAIEWLRAAADAVAEKDPQVAAAVPTLVAILAGRRMSMTSCATLPPRLGWDLGRKALLPMY